LPRTAGERHDPPERIFAARCLLRHAHGKRARFSSPQAIIRSASRYNFNLGILACNRAEETPWAVRQIAR
jgi:hypothetical protein